MNILDLLIQDGAAPRKKSSAGGKEEWCSMHPGCAAPGKNEDRLQIWPGEGRNSSGRAWCRQCKWRGDAISYLIDVRKKTYLEACQLIGMSLEDRKKVHRNNGHPPLPQPQSWKPKEYRLPPDLWQEKALMFLEKCVSFLDTPGLEILRYLREDRFLKMDTIRKHRLGYNNRDIWLSREEWGLPKELKVTSETKSREKKLWLPAGIAIPYYPDGSIARIRIRRKEGDPPYYFVPGSSPAPMVMDNGKLSSVIVESELDGILLDQEVSDLVNIIALGNAQTRPDKSAMDVLKRVGGIILNCLDSDEAGANEAWSWWNENIHGSKRWPVPVGKDPTDLMKEGPNRVRAWIMAGLGIRIEELERFKDEPKGSIDGIGRIYADTTGELRKFHAATYEEGRLFDRVRKYMRGKRYKVRYEPVTVDVDDKSRGIYIFFLADVRLALKVTVDPSEGYRVEGLGLSVAAPDKLVNVLEELAIRQELTFVRDSLKGGWILTHSYPVSLESKNALLRTIEKIRRFVMAAGDLWV